MVINEWLSTNVDSGEGNNKITLTSTANETGEDRTTSLIVRGRNKSATVNVRQLKQSGSEGWFFYVKNYSNIPVSGTNADRVLSVFSCNKPCTLIRYDIYKGQDLGMDFVTEETLEMVEGINNIYLNAESNIVDGVTNPWRFVAYAVVYEGKSYGYIPIYQQGSTPTITVTPNEVEFHKYGGTATIEITANTNWRIGGDNYKPQITFSNTFGKSGTHTISVTAQEYEGVEDLIYNLWVGLASNISVPLVIKQDSLDMPHNCFYIEPLTAEGTTITPDNSISYFQNGVWNELTASNSITITEKTYLKNFNKIDIFEKLNLIGKCNVGGNIETLLGEMKDNYAFQLFNNCDIVDASNLILPATTLAVSCYLNMFLFNSYLIKTPTLPATTLSSSCYAGMFSGCTSLTTAPALPATTLAVGCYFEMFLNCTSLVNAPKLPATTLARDCYGRILAYCTSLVNAPVLPVTTLSEECYNYMFQGCTSLVNAPELPATILADRCYEGMFIDCTSLTTPPQLPATTLAFRCYESMFQGCTSLTTAPKLPATTLERECYYGMFQGCTSLNNITMYATDISAYNCLINWVDDVSPTGTFYKNPNMDISNFSRDINGIPEGWEVRNYEG